MAILLLFITTAAVAQERTVAIEGVTVLGHRPMKEIGVQQTKLDSITLKENVALSLADFVAPKGYNDRVALFAVTVPKRLVTAIEKFKRRGDDYNALLYQSLADRVVEAASEYIHRQMRLSYFASCDDAKRLISAENRLSISQLFARPLATIFLHTYLAIYAALRSTLVGSLPLKAPPPTLAKE